MKLLQDGREIGVALLGGDDVGKETRRDGLFISLLSLIQQSLALIRLWKCRRESKDDVKTT